MTKKSMPQAQQGASAAFRGLLSLALAASMAGPGFTGLAYAEDAPASSASAAQDEQSFDLAALWQSNAPEITQAGSYRLDHDIEVSAPLSVRLAAGEAATIDLAGHTVTVSGNVSCAIEADSSLGELSIVDSTYDAKAKALAEGEQAPVAYATIRLLASQATESVAAIKSNATALATQSPEGVKLTLSRVNLQAAILSTDETLSDGTALTCFGVYEAETVADGEQPAANEVTIENCSVSAVAASASYEQEDAALDWAFTAEGRSVCTSKVGAYAIRTAAPAVSLAGTVELTAVSKDGGCELSSQVAGLFTFKEGLQLKAESTIALSEATDGATLAHCANDDEAARLSGSLSYATAGPAVKADGSDIKLASSSAYISSIGPAIAMTGTGASSANNTSANTDTNSTNGTQSSTGTAKAQPAGNEGAQLLEGGGDLNQLWADTAQSFSIEASGTYYLSGDLSVTSAGRINISAEGCDVTIDLGGHHVTTNLYSFGEFIRVSKANSVVIKNGSIDCASAKDYAAIKVEAANANVQLSDLTIVSRPSSEFVCFAPQQCYALSVSAGSVTASNCSFSSLQSAYIYTSSNNEPQHAIAVYVATGSKVKGVSFDNCSLTAATSPMATAKDRDTFWGPGYKAYGLYALCDAAVALSNCRFNASSSRGSSIAVYARNASFSGTNSLSTNAAYNAIGVQGIKEGGVALGGTLDVSFAGESSPHYAMGLYSQVEGAFTLNSGFAGTGLSAFVGQSAERANESGTLIASSSLGGSENSRIAGLMSNALGQNAACSVAASSQGLSFALVAANAPAELSDAGGTSRYSSVDQALEAATSGSTVRLLKDVEGITFASSDAATSVTLDMNGHTATSLTHTAKANLAVTSSGAGGGFAGAADTGQSAAVDHSGSGALSLSKVTVENYSNRNACTGISESGSGELTLNDVTVDSSSLSSKTIAVEVASKASGTISIYNGGIVAQTESVENSAGCYALWAESTKATVLVHDCPITARSVSTATGAVTASGKLSIEGSSADVQAITVTTRSASSEAWGVRGISASADITVDGCAIKVGNEKGEAADDGSFWCLMSGSSSSPLAVSWTLDGACSFESVGSGMVLQGAAPLSIGSEFALAGGETLSISSAMLEGDVFAQVADENGGLTKLAGVFSAAAGSVYEGWSVAAADADAKSLGWTTTDVARNTRANQSYTTLAHAIEAAKDGDTIQLMADTSTTDQIKVDKAITLDLNGRTAVIDTVQAGTDSAIAYSGSGSFSVTDSANNTGALSLIVGSAAEKGQMGVVSTKYKGIASTGTGTVSVKNATVQVRYAGSAVGDLAVTMYGLYTASGKIELGSSAQLNVYASDDSSSVGVSAVYGIYCDKAMGASSQVSVSASAKVNVENRTSAFENNTIATEGMGNTKLSNLSLVRIYPDPSSDLYAEILEKFIAEASFDDTAGNDGSSKFAGRVYHAEEIMLSTGQFMWAYSDYVPAGQETYDKIVPLVIFVQSTYTVEPQAFGIASAEGSTSNGTVSGTVIADAPSGEAFAVQIAGSGSWTLKNSSLTANAGTSSFHQRSSEVIDLRDYIPDAQVSTTKTWIYPSTLASYEVTTVLPKARGVVSSGDATTTLDGSTSINVTGADKAEVETATTLQVASTFIPTDEGTITVASTGGENQAGAELVRFLGNTDLSAATFQDASGELSAVWGDGNTLLWDGPYTVSFCNGTNPVITHEKLQSGDVVELPDATLFDNTTSVNEIYTLIGWSTKINAATAEVPLSAGSVTVTGNANYYPVYQVTARYVQAEFTNLRNADGSIAETQSVTVEAMKTMAQSGVAAPIARDFTGFDGESYRFIGWNVSGTTNVYCAEDIDAVLAFDFNMLTTTTTKVTLVAKYVRVREGECLVRFLTDGQVVAGAFKKGSVPEYTTVSIGSVAGPNKLNPEDGYDYLFAGFFNGHHDPTKTDVDVPDYSAAKSLPAVTGDVTYTAAFTKHHYYTWIRAKYWVEKNGKYSNTLGENIAVPYGEDPIDALNALVKVGDSFSQDGKTYTMMGWSPRESDIEPSYTAAMPASTNSSFSSTSAIYYAVYSTAEQSIDVVFHVNGEEYASASGLTSSQNVKKAFEASGAKDPSSTATKTFKGWATTEGATRVNAYGTSLLGNLAGNSATLHLYAVFGSTDSGVDDTVVEHGAPDGGTGDLTVSYYDSDGTTLLSTSKAEAGKTVEESGATIRYPIKAGKFFKGWVDEAGKSFDMSQTKVTADIKVIAAFGDLYVNVSDTANAKGSTDEAYLSTPQTVGKETATFEIESVTVIDEAIEKKITANKDTVIPDAAYQVYFKADSTKINAASDFGTVSLKLYKGTVAGGAKVKVYYLNAKGEVASTQATTIDETGMVSFDVTEYSMPSRTTACNVVIAQTKATTTAITGAIPTGTVSSAPVAATANVGAVTASNAAGASTPKVNAAPVGNVAGAQAANPMLEGTVGNDDATVQASIDADASAANEAAEAFKAVSGNPLFWAAGVLSCAAIGGGTWWGLIGKRREEGDDEEGDGWSDNAAGSEEQTAPQSAAAAGGIQL